MNPLRVNHRYIQRNPMPLQYSKARKLIAIPPSGNRLAFASEANRSKIFTEYAAERVYVIFVYCSEIEMKKNGGKQNFSEKHLHVYLLHALYSIINNQ